MARSGVTDNVTWVLRDAVGLQVDGRVDWVVVVVVLGFRFRI